MARVPHIDPAGGSYPLQDLLTQLVLSKPGKWLAMNVSRHLDPILLRLTGGRVSTMLTAPVVNLTARGAKTGKERTIALLYWNDGNDVILIASNFGGGRHPQWYYNLCANPDVTLTAGGRSGRYRAELVTDELERRRLYHKGQSLYSGWRNYEETAAESGRTIQVFRLSPRDPA